MVERALELKGNPAEGFFELPLAKQLTLLVGIAASIALGVYVVLWSRTPDFAPLYNQLNTKDSGDVVDALQRSNIAYKLDEKTGLVLVDASKIQEARIKLASQGIPNSSGNGFELLDKDSVFGNSQLLERARYIRALQGELEKTISSIENIKSARVHLAVPKQTTFLKDKKEPSASVFVDIYGGYKLESDQVAAITHLVASSIQGLSAQNVTVIDQNGKLLSSAGDDTLTAAAKQLDYTHKLEKIYAQRIQDLLSPWLGYDRVKAEVTASLDFTSVEETTENFDPKNTAIRSERLSDIQKSLNEDNASGIPGTMSNQPPTPGQAQPQPAAPPKSSVPSIPGAKGQGAQLPTAMSINKQATRNYEIDRQIKHQSNIPGKLVRLSVAVVVDDKVSYDENGKAVKTPLTDQDVAKIEKLVRDAIGYDKERGDRVTIINSSFAQAEPIENLPKPSFFENPMLMGIVKQVLAAIVFFTLILVVLRPIVKNLTNISSIKKKFLKDLETQEETEKLDNKNRKLNESEYNIKIKELINDDPKKAAQVIKQWVGIENEKSS
ncbi:MAG: flagellar M-ring protein FliF [Gammaproteobacteria bacterium 39-13]|nr:flagellar M-ring protein FliF [Gammaproteobacteria bacterium]OJV86591.1 MAG: flagellar M-ring protein FliF [Gammaproteobacteria bacterium 39-13]